MTPSLQVLTWKSSRSWVKQINRGIPSLYLFAAQNSTDFSKMREKIHQDLVRGLQLHFQTVL